MPTQDSDTASAGRSISGWLQKNDGLWAAGLLLLLGALVREILFFRFYHVYNDDAYIFLRYARNFAEGHGLVYNRGEWVLGFTSTAYPILIGGAAALLRFVSFEAIVNVCNILLYFGIGFMILRMREPGKSILPLPLYFWVLYFPFCDATMNGMETMLFVATIFGVAWLLGRKKWDGAALLALASLLVRPEGVCLFLAAGLAYFLTKEEKRFPWKGLVTAGILLFAWAWVAKGLYGSPIPNSMLAKSNAVSMGLSPKQMSAPVVLSSLALGVSSDTIIERHSLLPVLLIVALALYGAMVLGAKKLLNGHPAWTVLPAFVLLVAAFYIVGKPVRIWSWYAIPPSVALTWTVLQFLEAKAMEKRSTAMPWAIGAVCLFGLVSLAGGLPSRIKALKGLSVPLQHVSEGILEKYPSAQSVMLGDIGVLGYRTNLHVYDLANLITTNTAVKGADGKLISYGGLIQEYHPDILVLKNPLTRTGFKEQSLIIREQFISDSDYQSFLADYLPVDFGDGVYKGCYVRRSIAGTR